MNMYAQKNANIVYFSQENGPYLFRRRMEKLSRRGDVK